MKKLLLVFFLIVSQSCGGGSGEGSDFLEQSPNRSTKSAIRIIHGSIDATPISVYVNESLIQSAFFAEEKFYTEIPTGDTSLRLQTSNSPNSNSSFIDFTVEENTEYSILLSGSVMAGNFRVRLLEDITERPSQGFAFLQLVNTLIGAQSVSLSSAEFAIDSVSLHSASPFIEVPVGMHLINLLDSSGGVLSSIDLEVENQHEYSLLLTGSLDLGSIFVRIFQDLD